MHCPSNDVVDNLAELIDLRITFGFANLLNDHLLGCLSTNATDHFFVIKFVLAAATGDLTRVALDNKLNVGFFAKVLPRSRYQRRFNRDKNNLLLDVFLAMKGINNSQYFAGIHS